MGFLGGDASASVTVHANALGVSATVGKDDLSGCNCCGALIFRAGGAWIHYDGRGHCYVMPNRCATMGKCAAPRHGYANPQQVS